MDNPFAGLDVKVEENHEPSDEHQQKLVKRNEIYARYDELVNNVLSMFITTYRQGIWEIDSDFSRSFCCHVAWFAGPKEKYFDPYDIHHTLRRRLEVKLEMDGLCNPYGFKVTNYEQVVKTIHVGLAQDDLVRGIREVMG